MVTLWGRNNSTNVKKVRWTLAELGLPYEQIMAGQGFGVNHDADYLALNPNGLVPMLKDGDDVLWESNSIVRYLAAQYGADTLWQASPIQRAKSEKWMDWANETLSPTHRKILIGLVRTPAEKRNMAEIEAAIVACEPLLEILDNTLAQQTWLSGEQFGVGDIAAAPFVYNLLETVKTWQPRPHLARWYQQLADRPAFRDVVMIPVT
ncbi:glutathione S-transferase family protein [Kluyvera intermedia]|jgi:glutathione S-transferase|uniref:Glutathione S-transferase family protein n=1 Tax=Kluyvera intermedia TaxID=61648 RepID=A0AA95FYD4_KLUIN|nr:glutathione S-transferase family protein [Kluyvera intermedia]WEJ86192.1 MAG: glutathione S-transferase family protein [Kluyvera intermedia]WGL55012.1 glutathione S-transferase family protein [Kluyvera intermedia]